MRRLLLALFLACAAPSAAPAAIAHRVSPDAAEARLEGVPDVVHAGDVVEIRWRELPADVREVELELSLGGGRWVRISPELEALEGRFAWRAPQGVGGAAVLRLRAGGAGGERDVAECAFRLVGEASGPDLVVGWPGGWTREPRGGPAAAGLACPGPGVRAASPVTPLAPPAQGGLETAPGSVPTHGGGAVGVATARPPARPFRAPRRLPLRN